MIRQHVFDKCMQDLRELTRGGRNQQYLEADLRMYLEIFSALGAGDSYPPTAVLAMLAFINFKLYSEGDNLTPPQRAALRAQAAQASLASAAAQLPSVSPRTPQPPQPVVGQTWRQPPPQPQSPESEMIRQLRAELAASKRELAEANAILEQATQPVTQPAPMDVDSYPPGAASPGAGAPEMEPLVFPPQGDEAAPSEPAQPMTDEQRDLIEAKRALALSFAAESSGKQAGEIAVQSSSSFGGASAYMAPRQGAVMRDPGLPPNMPNYRR